MSQIRGLAETIVVSDVDWAWLAGIIDGEGNLSLYKGTEKGHDGKHRIRIRPQLKITNTNQLMIEKARRIMGNGHVIMRPGLPPQWKPVMNLVSTNHITLRRIIIHTVPHLTAKLGQARILIAFIERRLPNVRAPYTELDYEALKQVHHLNERGVRETL